MEGEKKNLIGSKGESPDSGERTSKSQSRESSEKSNKEKNSRQKHCLCKSNDDTTFMICCDKCGVWYHGDCVQVKSI